jgi:hypothetical protein
MENVFLLKVLLLCATAGFGLRLGWEALPVAEKAIAYVIAAPFWLYRALRNRRPA